MEVGHSAGKGSPRVKPVIGALLISQRLSLQETPWEIVHLITVNKKGWCDERNNALEVIVLWWGFIREKRENREQPDIQECTQKKSQGSGSHTTWEKVKGQGAWSLEKDNTENA